jgi:hypothetical protein
VRWTLPKRRRSRAALRVDPELRALVRELRSVTEALAGMAPALEPSAALKERVLLEIDQQRAAGSGAS